MVKNGALESHRTPADVKRREKQARQSSRTISLLRNTAYHEAGHAVVAWVIEPRVSFKQVSIVPGEGSLGHMLHTRLPRRIVDQIEYGLSPMGRLHLESYAIVSFAGRIAESKHRECPVRWGHHGDYGDVADYILRVCGDDRDLQKAWSSWMHLQAKATVNQYWPEIQSVAAALLEKKTLRLKDFIPIFGGARGIPSISRREPAGARMGSK